MERLPREAGISPTKRLSSKSKLVKLERLPNSSGMLPVILLPASDLQDHMLKFHSSPREGPENQIAPSLNISSCTTHIYK